ncbi:retrotransposon protein, putative, ty1-copia subclass [Tanacetum coccineum]
MFKREKLSGTNFNDWFRQLKLVLRVEKKMFIIDKPIHPAPVVDSKANVLAEWNAIYDAYNEMACLMLRKEDKSVDAYVLKMKGYVKQLEHLGYVLPKDLSVGLILNDITSDFARFVSNYSMHNMGKTIGELHAMLIEYEKGLPKKAETRQAMMIKDGKISKANKKSLKAKGKGKPNGKGKDKQVYIPKPKNPKPSAKEHTTKDGTCHHCKEVGHWKRNYSVYLAELLKKKKQLGTASSSSIFTIELFSFPNKSCVYDTGCGTHICITKQGFREARKLKQGALYLYDGNGVRALVEAIGSFDLVLHNGLMTRKSFPHRPERVSDLLRIIHIDVCGPLRHVSRQDASYFITFTDDYSRYGYVYLLKHEHEVFETFKNTPPYTPQHNGLSERRNRTLLDMVRSMMNLTTLPLSFWDYAQEFETRILNMVPTKKVDKTPYELWYGKVPNLSYLKFFEKSLISKEVSGRAVDLEEIQDRDTSPSKITSEIPIEVEGFEPPQEEVISVRRSERTHRDPTCLCLNVEAEEHSLGDLNEPTSYKVAMLDPESNKWFDAMNTKMQSMIDNMVWVLVNLPPNYDIIIMGNHIPSLQSAKDYLGKCFAIKDLGEAAFILGIKIYRDRQDLNKTQGASTHEEVKRMQNVPYASAVESIMYANVVKNILKYLRNTKDMFLVYGGNPEAELRVDCYCDAGFETNRDDIKFQTGYVFILNGGAVD